MCGYGLVVEHVLAKDETGVRFSLPAHSLVLSSCFSPTCEKRHQCKGNDGCGEERRDHAVKADCLNHKNLEIHKPKRKQESREPEEGHGGFSPPFAANRVEEGEREHWEVEDEAIGRDREAHNLAVGPRENIATAAGNGTGRLPARVV